VPDVEAVGGGQGRDGKVVGCHPSKKAALAQLAALNANVKQEALPMTDRAALHAEAAKARAGEFGSQRQTLPLGNNKRDGRDPATWVHTEFRAQTVQRDGRDFYQLEGYASMVGKPYQMYDMFGPYDETVDPHAFDETLAGEPMVVYRFNHGGCRWRRPVTAGSSCGLTRWGWGTGRS
jgi:hypothetical protein